jgi:hypothetical protein
MDERRPHQLHALAIRIHQPAYAVYSGRHRTFRALSRHPASMRRILRLDMPYQSGGGAGGSGAPPTEILPVVLGAVGFFRAAMTGGLARTDDCWGAGVAVLFSTSIVAVKAAT